MSNELLRLEHLSVDYRISSGCLSAVNDVSFAIGEGEIFALVGESGCGKTTFARILLGLTGANNGSLMVGDVDTVKANRRQIREVRNSFAVVFQYPASNLNPRQTVESSIIRPLIIKGVSKAEAKKRAREALSKVQMDESYLLSYPHQLSGGQQQRIAIARALVMQPKVMILDEPTSALDISVQAQVLNLLLKLQEELKLTYIIITHDLNVIRYVSDRIAVMYMGRLVEYGDTDDVLNNPLHPYTNILINSVPAADPDLRSDKVYELPGEPEDVPSAPDACRLCLRCPYAGERCAHEVPVMREETPGHFVECFRAL